MLPGIELVYRIDTSPSVARPALASDIEVDVAGATGHTTAKLSSLHTVL